MKKALLVVALVFLLSTCKKHNAFGKIEIEAVDYYTGEPIEGVQYLLYKTPPGELLKTKTIHKEKTDANGKLTLKYSRIHLIRKYELRTDYFEDLAENNPNYLIVNEIDGTQDVNGEKDLLLLNDLARIKIKSYFVYYGNFKPIYENINCEDINDTLFLKRIYKPTNEEYIVGAYINGVPSSNENYNGCFNIIGNKFIKVPSGEYQYVGYIKRTSGITNIDTTVFILPNQDNIIHLQF